MGLFLFRTNIFVYIVIEGFNNLLFHCSSLKGYFRTKQQDEVAKCHILGIVLWTMREMQVNVIQTVRNYGSNVEVNKQHVNVVKRCRKVMVPISWESVMLQMVLGYSFCPLSYLGHLESLCCYGYYFIIFLNIFEKFFPQIYCGHLSNFFWKSSQCGFMNFSVVNHP
jgi:hypothetical protein